MVRSLKSSLFRWSAGQYFRKTIRERFPAADTQKIAASLDIFGNKRDVDSRADVEALDALTPAMSCAPHNKWRLRPSIFPIVKVKYSLYINDKIE